MVLFHVMVDDCSSTLLVCLRDYMRGPRLSVVPGECPEPAHNFSWAASVFIRMTLRVGDGGVPVSLAFAWDGSVGWQRGRNRGSYR
jgi:hypothetical protein